jgi:hypothetical protein
MIPSNLTYEQVINAMITCEQTKGMSVLEHGDLVNRYYKDLMAHLETGAQLQFEWKLPKWVYDYKDVILREIYSPDTMNRYQLMHDCGKPYCRIIDEDGKQHFPDHAEVSYQVAKQIFPTDFLVHDLIKGDMDIHCLKGEDVEAFANRYESISLMITGLCEIHANASMFGGLESTSFKIKWKQIDRKGRQVLTVFVEKNT